MEFRSHPAATVCCDSEATDRARRAATLRVIAIVALASTPFLAGCRQTFVQSRLTPTEDAPAPGVALTLAQAPPPTGPSAAPSTPRDQPIGLPRVRDYESIPQLRDIHFDFGKAEIRPADVKILDANAAWLRANPNYLVLIEGHSDNQGVTSRKKEFNVDLGERRAQAAMNRLVAEGVDASRITILSYGEERPQCAEQTERCWSENRRSRFLVKRR